MYAGTIANRLVYKESQSKTTFGIFHEIRFYFRWNGMRDTKNIKYELQPAEARLDLLDIDLVKVLANNSRHAGLHYFRFRH